AEELGFDSVWATDHLLHGSRFYAVPWLDPIVSLSYVAAATSRLRLGTSVLVLPTRHPVVLAKEIATLQALANERYILGAGTGWDDREFEAVGQRRAERGGRTDESIALIRRLLAGEAVTYEGKYYQLRDVEVGPAMRSPLRLWSAGGRQLPHAASPERPVMAPAVRRRIAASDGWIARPTSLPAQIAEDLAEIRPALEAAGRDPAAFTFAHENFLHLVPTEDRAKALAEQRRAYAEIMGQHGPFEYFEQVYLTGTPSEIVAKLRERLATGIEYLILHTLQPSAAQLDLWAEHLLPRLEP
ncbi:MAG: TIGR03619 family F420-dependent LLM class oxidoreductase, partial [Actinobacteria bacterium]|nr:TIGR03619 family F420-dependent LLM class oxidoreductase [Actinomycetota bacterium]